MSIWIRFAELCGLSLLGSILSEIGSTSAPDKSSCSVYKNKEEKDRRKGNLNILSNIRDVAFGFSVSILLRFCGKILGWIEISHALKWYRNW